MTNNYYYNKRKVIWYLLGLRKWLADWWWLQHSVKTSASYFQA